MRRVRRGDYDDALTQILLKPRAEVGRAVNHIHTRLLWCQIDAGDLDLLRDHILVPALLGALKPGADAKKPAPEAAVLDDLTALVALVPPPPADPAHGKAVEAYTQLRNAIKADDARERAFVARQQRVARQRANPPAMVRKLDFCAAGDADAAGDGLR